MGTSCELFYFRKQEIQSVAKILKTSKIKAFLLPKKDNWICVIPQNNFKPPEALLKKYDGTLLHFFHNDEYGWGLVIYHKKNCISSYQCTWGDRIKCTNYLYPEILEKLFGKSFKNISSKDNKKIFFPKKADLRKMLPDGPGKLFAEKAKLPFADSDFFLTLNYESLRGDPTTRKMLLPTLS